MLKRDDIFTDIITRVIRCDSLLDRLDLSYAQTRWTQEFLGLIWQSEIAIQVWPNPSEDWVDPRPTTQSTSCLKTNQS
jgi:hypothetical protein